MASRRRIEVDIVAHDQASNAFQNVRTQASGMASSLMSSLGGTVNAVGNLDKALRNYNNAMYRFNRVAGMVFRAAGRSIVDFTRDAINNFSELERQHAKTMGAMATEYGRTAEAQRKFLDDSEKLKQQALNLGTYGVGGKGSLNSVIDVSYAQTALVKAGVVKDNDVDKLINSGAVESILKFAGGNDLDIDTATTFAVNLATVFDKPIEEWGNMLDMVTKAADISVIDVPDIMESLTYTGGIASGLGRDLEEVLGIISVMGQAGLRGRVAGTGLQAFFTRILSAGELSDTQIGNAPTEYVGNLYNAFVAETVDENGKFKPMDEVAASLDTVMESLNDQEQAWFAKKLFGLYQMKAAYALTGSVDENGNMITDFINQIANQSQGANDIKYNLTLASQYGKLESVKNLWSGIKTDFGDRLSPTVKTVADELFNFFNDPNNYKIDWEKVRQSLSESGDKIAERYGEEIGQFVEDLGNFGINTGMIAGALTPEVGGILSGIGKLLNGDISGAISDFYNGISETNKEIEDLPPELQGTAKAARNVIGAFTVLSGINLATQIVQILTTALNTFIAKPIKWALGKVNSTKTDVATTTTTITTSAVNIGSVPLMNVTANIVNVYGMGGNPTNPINPTNPTIPTLPGNNPTTPTLPPVGMPGGTPILIPPITNTPTGLPGNTTNTPQLPGNTSGNLPARAPGSIPVGGWTGTTFFSLDWGYAGTPDQVANTIVRREAGLPRSVSDASILYDDFSKGYTSAFTVDPSKHEDWLSQYPGYTPKDGLFGNIFNEELHKSIIIGKTNARNEMMEYYGSISGKSYLNQLFNDQILNNGKITEEFLQGIVTWDKDGYTYVGADEDIKEILRILYNNFDDDYKGNKMYYGNFNESAVDKFLKNRLVNNAENGVLGLNGNIFTGDAEAFNNLLSAMDRIQKPNVNVNVVTNVDKSGNTTTKVDVNGISRDIARRGSQYGQMTMQW